MKFSIFVKEVRKQLGMSQEQLANALNVSFSTINRWENSKTEPSNLAQKTFSDFCEGNLIKIPDNIRNNKSE
jgi:Predicted transcription factor, homolog of eukaryotic MBF1